MPTSVELWNEFRQQATGWEVPPIGVFPDIPVDVFPLTENIFRSFSLVKREDVRFVILGQDPYYQKGLDGRPIATGAAFGINDLTNVRRGDASSLYKVLKGIYGPNKTRYRKSNLEDWAKCKGILLLNTALTVPTQQIGELPRANVGRHLGIWTAFIKTVIQTLPERSVTLVAWGKPAFTFVTDAFPNRKNVLQCNHPASSCGELQSFSAFWDKDGRGLKCGYAAGK